MTYQLLLVDDEVHAIEGVKSDLDLEKLNISTLFTAYNIRQAKEIFDREHIDIMICDIEMPQGSGLELLSWVRERYAGTQTIFLTSHADFKYAKEALQLGSLDYLLKPVLASALESAIQNAQIVIDRNSENKRNSQSHQLWLKHHSLVIERFWLDVINHSLPSVPAAIREQIERDHIPITDNSVFIPILISVKRWNKPLKRRDEKIMEYALKNSAEEMILGGYGNGICIQIERGMQLVILEAAIGTNGDHKELMDACRRYIDSCNQYFYCDLSCYFGKPVETHQMAGMVAELKARDQNNVVYVNIVYAYSQTDKQNRMITLPAMYVVASLLKTGTKEAVMHEVETYLDQLIKNMDINANILHQFNQDFMQVLYAFLNTKGIQAHQLFGDEVSRQLAETAGRSVPEMKAWVSHVIQKAMSQVDAVKETDTVVETVKRFIAQNIDQDLSRETIAEQVFLNPDHLTRIFKKETSYGISDYVLLERIQMAKELLSQTSIPISSIASSVGYSNFSHFTKIFKKYAGTGPTEYRSNFADSKMT